MWKTSKGYFWWELTPEQRKIAIFSHYEPNGLSEEVAYENGENTISEVYILPNNENKPE